MPIPIPIHPAMLSEPGVNADLATLARTYGELVYRAAYRVLGDAALAEDVQQEVFLRVLEAPTPAVASWPAYLTALSVRRAIDTLRRQQSWRRWLPGWTQQSAVSSASVESEVLDEERTRRLRKALTRLRPQLAECFLLRCVHGLELTEIANALGLGVNHVSVNLNRATRQLEALLADTTAKEQSHE